MDEKITDIRFNPIKFHPKKKIYELFIIVRSNESQFDLINRVNNSI